MKFKISQSIFYQDSLFVLIDSIGEIHWAFPKWDDKRLYQKNPKHILCDKGTIPNYYSCTRCNARPPYQYVRYWKTLCNLQLDL